MKASKTLRTYTVEGEPGSMFSLMVRNKSQNFYLLTGKSFSNVAFTIHVVHGIYIRWRVINRCARKEQSLLFDLYKAFD